MELHQASWRVQFLEIVCGCVVDRGQLIISQIKHKVQYEIWEGIMSTIHVSYIYYNIMWNSLQACTRSSNNKERIWVS